MALTAEERAGATLVIEGDGTLGPDSADGADASQQWAEFEQLRDQGEGTTRGMHVWAYRIPTDSLGNPVSNVDSELLFVVPIDVYPSLAQIFDRVKKEYMPRGLGRALVRIQVRREKARGVLWAKVFAIIKGAKDDEPEATRPGAATGEAVSLQAIAQLFNQTLAAAQEQNRQMLAAILTRANPAALPAPVDPMTATKEMIGMVTGLTAAIANGRALAGPVAAPQTMGDMAKGFREMLALAKEFGGIGGGESAEPEGIAGIMKSLSPWAPVFAEMVKGARQNPALLPPARIQRRPLTPAEIAARQARAAAQAPPNLGAAPQVEVPHDAVQPQAAPAKPSGGDAMLMKVVEMTNDLIRLKAGGGEPVAIGKSVAQMLPVELQDQILDLLDSDDWFEKLSGFNPAVKDHREFFQSVRDAVLAEYEVIESTPDGDGHAPPS